MIPVLYPSNKREFSDLGLGFLPHWIKDTPEVAEERNGEFFFQGELPVGALNVDKLAIDRIILAAPAPGKDPQPFRIQDLSKPDGRETVRVLAPHVSYQLTQSILKPTTFTINGDVESIVRNVIMLKGVPAIYSLVGTKFFEFESDIIVSSPVEFDTLADWKYTTIREALGGMEGSIADLVGGELEWDGWTVRLLKRRGKFVDKPIRYGQNLGSLSFETDARALVTAYIGYAERADGLMRESSLVRSPDAYLYAYPRVQVINFTQHFRDLGNENPSFDDVQAATEAYAAGHPGNLRTSIKIDVVPDELQGVQLCDTVPVIHPGYDLQQSAKVVKTVFDPVEEKYKQLTIGELQKDITSTIAGLLRR